MIDPNATAQQLFTQLNQLDESNTIEAKTGSDVDKSIMETVCAFANEPGQGGGVILLGVRREENTLFPMYEPVAVRNLDKLQSDLVTRCATEFNQPIRPDVTADTINGVPVLRVYVPELPESTKPLYFKNQGLPRGAFRRIGPSDVRCTDEDLPVFYHNGNSYDTTLLPKSDANDVDPEAVAYYRQLRAKVKPDAEELTYDDADLLRSLGCADKTPDGLKLTVAGLVLFGKQMALRRLMPMLRVDYIRVPGNEWVADPHNRFYTVDMRGSLLLILRRLQALIADDLPRGFLLPEGELQAQSTGLPTRVLREALVNSLMHRSFRINQPNQVIRYGNRIEIRNPGYSLKAEDLLGEPGSITRNSHIAAVFHETNLAETKGSGIRTMRKLLTEAGLGLPTYESSHEANEFMTRLLMHHFLSEEDLEWLSFFEPYQLSDAQKNALIFVREVGAINNPTYRQFNNCDSLRASTDLRQLRESGLLDSKGRSRATYYLASDFLKLLSSKTTNLSAPADELTAPVPGLIAPVPGLIKPVVGRTEPVPRLTEPVPQALPNQFPAELVAALTQIGRRSNDREALDDAIVKLCAWKPLTLNQLARYLNRNEKHLLYNYVTPLREAGRLAYVYPEMPNHPQQAYRTVTNKP